jgi:hypothetical protein
MNVDIISKEANTEMIKVPVRDSWIGGQIANIVNNDNKKYEYKVTLMAIEDGVFSVEARGTNSVISINDKSIRFDTVRPSESLCYRFNIDAKNQDDGLVVQTKSIKGDLSLNIYPESGNSINEAITVQVASEKEQTYTLTPNDRKLKQNQSGNWLICVNSNAESAYFQLNAFLENNTSAVKEYKKLLIG